MNTHINGPMTVTSYVANSIRERILNGYYTAGSRLDQQTLLEELGVSLIPVRESLRQLEVEGLVQIFPNRGAFVAQLSLEDLQEIYLVREVLEEKATQLAVPQLSEQTMAELGEMIAAMERATQAEDYALLFDLNRAFHFSIYQASHNTLLIHLIGSLWDRSRRYRQLYTFLPKRAPQALLEHKGIFEACKAGDGLSAGAAVRENVRQTTIGIIEKYHEANK